MGYVEFTTDAGLAYVIAEKVASIIPAGGDLKGTHSIVRWHQGLGTTDFALVVQGTTEENFKKLAACLQK